MTTDKVTPTHPLVQWRGSGFSPLHPQTAPVSESRSSGYPVRPPRLSSFCLPTPRRQAQRDIPPTLTPSSPSGQVSCHQLHRCSEVTFALWIRLLSRRHLRRCCLRLPGRRAAGPQYYWMFSAVSFYHNRPLQRCVFPTAAGVKPISSSFSHLCWRALLCPPTRGGGLTYRFLDGLTQPVRLAPPGYLKGCANFALLTARSGLCPVS